MKFLAVHLKSFRAGVNLTIPTDAARVLIAGTNGSGKTSLREALRWALTGRAAVTDDRGVGSQKLTPTGENAVEVALELAGLGGVSRSLAGTTRAFAVQGFTGDATTQNQALYDHLGTTPAYLEAVLDSGHFLALHHADAKGLILALLDVRVQDGEVELTLDEVDAKHEAAFTDRKVAKKRLATFTVPAYPAGDQPHKVEEIEAQLSKIRTQLEGLTSTIGKAAGQRQALQAQLTLARTFTPFKADLSAEDVDRQIGLLETSIAELEVAAEVGLALPTVQADASASQDVTVIRRTIDALNAHKPKGGCVLDSGVPCETHKIKFNNRVKALQSTLNALPTAEPASGGVNPPSAPSPLTEARRRLQSLRVLKAKYDASAVQQRDREAEVNRLTAALAELPADAQGEADIVALKARIQKGEGILATARAYWTALYHHQEGLKERDRLKAEVDRLEAEVEKYGPNGLKAEALGQAIGAFATKVNRFTSLFGWTLSFEVEPWGVTANGRPVETYSESEQFLIGIALQLAIAEVSGLSFAVVDRLDMLLAEGRAKATQMLLSCPLEQVFILSSREPSQPLPKIEGVIAHRLERVNGRTRIAESIGL